MPFARHSGYSFSTVSIRQNAPNCSGIYGLSNASEWIFIAAANDIQSALLGHLREINTAFSSRRATGFTFEACDPAYCTERRNTLITELHPVCNDTANA
jgi:hypothetical protein